MRQMLLAAALSLAPLVATAHPPASPAPTGFVQDFGPNLKATCPNPEGIALDRQGHLYASSFAFTPTAQICVLDHGGRLLRTIPVAAGAGGVASLLGMLFVPGQGLYVTDFADGVAPHGRLLRLDGHGSATVLSDGFAAPNAVAVDRHGRLYVSDSFLGTITRLGPDGSGRVTWASDPRLQTAGQPPFGANGLAFDAHERFLYVANTGDSTVLRIPLEADGTAGALEVFARGADLDAATGSTQSLHGADGIAFDVEGNLWVCANQANEIQVLSPDAELIARYRGSGAGALDFPASLVFRGRTLYLTNLSLNDAGINSKLSVMVAPLPGARLVP
jgi:sugar lactone lactonase YvrE